MSADGLSAPNTKRGQLNASCLKLMREHERDGALPSACRVPI